MAFLLLFYQSGIFTQLESPVLSNWGFFVEYIKNKVSSTILAISGRITFLPCKIYNLDFKRGAILSSKEWICKRFLDYTGLN
jgi:hypothetical protein